MMKPPPRLDATISSTPKMTKRGALALAQKLWGERAMVRDNGRAVTRERREQARTALAAHREQRPTTIDPKVFAALPEDERRAHNAAYRAWRQREQELLPIALQSRFDVGYLMMGGAAFGIQGSGDTWEDAFTHAERLRTRR